MSARLQATQGTHNVSNGTAPTKNLSRTTDKGKERADENGMDVSSDSDLTSLEESPGPESEEDIPCNNKGKGREIPRNDKGKGREIDRDASDAEHEEPVAEESDEEPVRWNGFTEDGEDNEILAREQGRVAAEAAFLQLAQAREARRKVLLEMSQARREGSRRDAAAARLDEMRTAAIGRRHRIAENRARFESQARRVASRRRPASYEVDQLDAASDANDLADATTRALEDVEEGNRVACATAIRSMARTLRLAAFAAAQQEILTGSVGPDFDIYDEEEDVDAHDLNTEARENMAYFEELRAELYFDDDHPRN